MRELNVELDRANSAKEVKPFKFVSLFRAAYPMFAAQSEQGGFQQQDAEECWSTLVSALAARMLVPKGSEQSDLPSAPGPLLPRMEVSLTLTLTLSLTLTLTLTLTRCSRAWR